MAIAREVPAETLRARKKRQTRERVAAVAARLFRTHGYERVRMRDIAKAADVAEQTLYNYFPTKEHLIFDLDQEFEQRLVDVVRQRRLGTTIARAVGREATRFLGELLKSMDKPQAFRRQWLSVRRCGGCGSTSTRGRPIVSPTRSEKTLTSPTVPRPRQSPRDPSWRFSR